MSCVYFRSEDVKELFSYFIESGDSASGIRVEKSDIKAIDETAIGINISNLDKLDTKELLSEFGAKHNYSWVLRVEENVGFYTIGYFSSDGNYFPNHHTCNKYGIAVDRSGYFYDTKFDNGKYIEEESSWSFISDNFDIYAWEEI